VSETNGSTERSLGFADPSTDWAGEAADAIERAVAKVRSQTVDRAHGATTGVIYGLLAACLALPAIFLMVVMFFRLLVAALDSWAGLGAWAAWVVLGGIFFAVGLLMWARRRRV
jgi:hypothetical protein